ncbi:hypothetical protein V5T82_07325 [Magnetovibrio sp. PR-2]|uniref:hypothetical protein n=1 Tax=Magnetovibrio sp. PR-2 TaxID=3120356 RepID=UPI002FCDE430
MRPPNNKQIADALEQTLLDLGTDWVNDPDLALYRLQELVSELHLMHREILGQDVRVH